MLSDRILFRHRVHRTCIRRVFDRGSLVLRQFRSVLIGNPKYKYGMVEETMVCCCTLVSFQISRLCVCRVCSSNTPLAIPPNVLWMLLVHSTNFICKQHPHSTASPPRSSPVFSPARQAVRGLTADGTVISGMIPAT